MNIQLFQDAQIRFVQDETGKYEFGIVAQDLAAVLEAEQHGGKFTRAVDDDYKGVLNVDTLGGTQSMTVIWEPGIYEVLAKSRKPKAKPFKKWLFEEVLPSIRKTGSYSVQTQPQLPQTYLEALEALVVSEKEKQKLEAEKALLDAQAKENRPKVEFAEAVQASGNSLTMNEYAKCINWGRNRLFKLLRELEIIMKNSTLPYQRYVDAGYFEVSQEILPHNGKLVPFCLVTGKGQLWLNQKIKFALQQKETLLFQGTLDIE